MIQLTDRDCDLLEVLARRVRLLTLVDCSRLGWPSAGGLGPARRRLSALASAGWIELHQITARALPTNPTPMFVWEPGQDEPDIEMLSRLFRRRRLPESRLVTVCTASALTANLWGSAARGLPPVEQRQHDLDLSKVYVHLRLHSPELAIGWVGPQVRSLAGVGMCEPDALIHDARDRCCRVVEVVGRSGPRRLLRIHEFCEESSLPYELW